MPSFPELGNLSSVSYRLDQLISQCDFQPSQLSKDASPELGQVWDRQAEGWLEIRDRLVKELKVQTEPKTKAREKSDYQKNRKCKISDMEMLKNEKSSGKRELTNSGGRKDRYWHNGGKGKQGNRGVY